MSNHDPMKMIDITQRSFMMRPKTSTSSSFRKTLDRFIGVTYDDTTKDGEFTQPSDITFNNLVQASINEAREKA